MSTLKVIITEYINLLDKPFDTALYRRVRQIILNQRAMEISAQAHKYGIDNSQVQYIRPTFEVVKNDLSVIKNDNEDLIKTSNKILRSAIKMSNESPFTYVGSSDISLPFLYANNKSSIGSLRRSKHFNRVPIYFLHNSEVWALVTKGTIELAIGNVWHDPGLIDLTNDYIEEEYFDDDYEFLISHDMLQTIKEKLIKGELGILNTDDKEVKVDEQKEQGAS